MVLLAHYLHASSFRRSTKTGTVSGWAEKHRHGLPCTVWRSLCGTQANRRPSGVFGFSPRHGDKADDDAVSLKLAGAAGDWPESFVLPGSQWFLANIHPMTGATSDEKGGFGLLANDDH